MPSRKHKPRSKAGTTRSNHQGRNTTETLPSSSKSREATVLVKSTTINFQVDTQKRGDVGKVNKEVRNDLCQSCHGLVSNSTHMSLPYCRALENMYVHYHSPHTSKKLTYLQDPQERLRRDRTILIITKGLEPCSPQQQRPVISALSSGLLLSRPTNGNRKQTCRID
jgi:hypothetical protein